MRQGTKCTLAFRTVGLFLFIASLPVFALTAEEAAKLLASDGAASDRFGVSVAISGDRAVIGAIAGGDNGSGSAYVFERDGVGNWTEVAKLLAASDRFGESVAISGDRALIGAYGDDENGSFSGSVYVFERDGAGNWSEVAKLLASDGAAGDAFGGSVAISDDRAVIGAIAGGDNGSGSAYVFERDGVGNWTEVAKLLASDGAAGHQFGSAISISGDRALIGAYGDDENGSFSGSAYVFERDGVGNWTEVAKLLASDGSVQDFFGATVAISDDRAVIGAYRDGDNGTRSGSAYVFERDGAGNWSQVAKLLASDGAEEDRFGSSVSISSDRAVVGAGQHDDNGTYSGSAYVFERDDTGNWSEEAKLLASDGVAIDYFGGSVAISGDLVLIGAYGDDDNGSASGSAYVFNLLSDDPVPDTTPPVITLQGANPQNLTVGNTYTELGATAIDDPGAVDISDQIVIDASGVDTTTSGTYQVTYNVTDAAGNAAVEVVRVVVVGDGPPPPDTISPVITLLGDNPQTLTVGDSYTEPGATAIDDPGAVDISDQIEIDASGVDTTTAGTYQVTYNVTDAAGNDADEVVRTVVVEDAPDTIEPVITLLGDNPQTLTVGDTYTELGATAIDDPGAVDISEQIVIDSSGVDTTTAGTYQVTYNVTDAAGNDAIEVVRTVVVEAAPDTINPVITLLGDNPQPLTVGDTYTELGATAIDDPGAVDISDQIVTDASGVDTTTAGSYQVTYNVTDAAGNAAIEVVRTVEVLMPRDPERYAVLTGIESSITDMRRYLLNSGWKPENIFSPLGDDPVWNDLWITSIPARSGDDFLFYYGGHGGPAPTKYENGQDIEEEELRDGETHYFSQDSYSKHDLRNGDPIRYALDELIAIETENGDWLYDDDLANLFKGNTVAGDPWDDVAKTFIIDACMSGGFWGGNDTPEEGGGDLEQLVNTRLIASSAEDEYTEARILPGTGRKWTYLTDVVLENALLDRDREADTDGDGIVTFVELEDYIAERPPLLFSNSHVLLEDPIDFDALHSGVQTLQYFSNVPPEIEATEALGELTIPVGTSFPVAIINLEGNDDNLSRIVKCTDTEEADVTLNGSASYDPDGDLLTYLWEGPFEEMVSDTVAMTLPVGTHTIELTVEDGDGGIDMDMVEVEVKEGPLCEGVGASVAFDRRDANRRHRRGYKGKEFVAHLDIERNGSVDETEIVGKKIAGGGRVKKLTNADQDGFVDVRGFKTYRGFEPVGDLDIADLVEEGFRFNKGRFGIDKSGKRKKQGFPGDEGEKSGAKLLNAHELLLFDFSDSDFRANEATLDIKVSKRDDAGTLDGNLVLLERNGSPDQFTVLRTPAFSPTGNGTVTLDSLDGASVVGIILGTGEAGQVGVSFAGTTTVLAP